MAEFCASAAQCPFYHQESTSRDDVVCEGVTDSSIIRLSFSGPAKAKAYREKYCYDDYKKCRICGMLYGKYET